MKLSEIYKIADALAPKRLSDEYCAKYQGYDNSGILVDTGKDVRGILFSVDLTLQSIERAIEIGANLIVTHHPAIYGKIGNVCDGAFDPLGRKLITAIERGVSVLSMHLNLDMAEGGVDESLMDGVVEAARLVSDKPFEKETPKETMWQVAGGGYGRAYRLPEVTLSAFAEGLKKTFASDRVTVYGDPDRVLKKAASFCGSGGDPESVEYAYTRGADVVVSSEFKHHALTLALEKGLAVAQLTHYASEEYGVKKYFEKIRRQVEIPCVFYADDRLR